MRYGQDLQRLDILEKKRMERDGTFPFRVRYSYKHFVDHNGGNCGFDFEGAT